jgi:predicted RNA-binding protein YlqC (UPF0109 family)
MILKGEIMEIKDLVEQIAKSLVDKSEAVSVKEAKAERTTVLELRVAQEDLGKVIGKHGRTAIAIRTILIAAGKKIGRHFILEILE